MNEQKIQTRLKELRRELQAGQEQLEALESRRSDLERTLLRISGAIQVLEEMLEAPEPADTEE